MGLFVIPCKFDPSNPLIFDCVARIRRHHPNDDIVVVDSASDDRSYFRHVEVMGAQVADIENRHYATGAHAWAYENHDDDYDYFFMLADSVLLNAPLPTPDDIQFVRHFEYPRHGWGVDQHGTDLSVFGRSVLEAIDVPFPEGPFTGILGPYAWGPTWIFDDLAWGGLYDTPPYDKWQQCALERTHGIIVAHHGYDVRRSLQGEHHDHFGQYDESVVTKVNAGRY